MDRVLVFTYTAGYRHSYITAAVEVLVKLGERSRLFDVYVSEDLEDIDRSSLRDFNALVFLTSGEIPFTEDQKNLIVEFVESGGGFIGVHNAADTLYSFDRYGEMLGGYFHSHPWIQRAVFIVEDQNHISTRHLPRNFEEFEEIYVFKKWIGADKTHMLIRLDPSSVDLTKMPSDAEKRLPMAWCHRYGDGRVFYTAFGHFTALWRKEWFQRHILGGILWALGLET